MRLVDRSQLIVTPFAHCMLHSLQLELHGERNGGDAQ